MTEREWRQANKEHLRDYYRDYVKRTICDMKCFECKFSDCRNPKPPTKKETQMIRDAMGRDDPALLRKKAEDQKEYARIYRRMKYAQKKRARS